MVVGQLFLCQPKYMINNCQKLKSGQNPLGYTNGRKAVADHVERGDVTKRDTPIPNQHGVLVNQSVTYITESGVYALIFGSKQVVS